MPSPIKNNLVSQLEWIVAENLQNEQFGVEELADKVGINRSHLHRKLKDATGQSISQFIREFRLKKAHELLKSRDLTSSEVAYKVGFGSATYFSKAFHDFYGYTPGEVGNGSKSAEETGSKINKPLYFGSALILIIASLFIYFFFFKDKPANDTDNKPEKTIAVLPFKNLSSDNENQYFADGVMDAILNKLAAVEDLKVTSRTSVEKYRNNTENSLTEIAEELNVNYILEGSGQKYGNEIRITAQLIKASTDNHIWSQEYTRKFEYVLQLQNEIAQSVAKELEATLSTEDQRQLAEMPTENLEAYEYYLQGDYQMRQWSEKGFKNAVLLLEKAIELDSQFVEPYIGIGNIYAWGGAVWGIYSQKEAKEKSLLYLYKALEINPKHHEALNIIASVYFYHEWDFDKTLEYLNKSKAILGYYGGFSVDYFRKIGKLDKALQIEENQIKKAPLESDHYPFKAEILFLKGRKKEAIEILDRNYPLYDDFFFLRECTKQYYLYGKIERSKDALQKIKRKYPDRSPIYLWLEAMYAFLYGDDPIPFINKLKRMYEEGSSGSPAWFIALCYADMGNEDKLFEWLEKSYQKHEVEMTWLKMETTLDPYKDDPRYQDLLERVGFSR